MPCQFFIVGSSYPAPGYFVSKGAANQRSQDGRDAVRCSRKAQKPWTVLRGRSKRKNRKYAHAYSGSAKTSNGPANDESGGILSHGAHQAAHFENEDGNQEPELYGEVLVELAPSRLKSYPD